MQSGYEEFASYVRAKRSESGMTMSALAKRGGLTAADISQASAPRERPRGYGSGYMKKLARSLQCTVEELRSRLPAFSAPTKLGTTVKYWRWEANLNRHELAEKAGLKRQDIGAIERGEKTYLAPSAAARLARALGKPGILAGLCGRPLGRPKRKQSDHPQLPFP